MNTTINTTMKQYTEPIFDRLAAFGAELDQHPLLTAAKDGEVDDATLRQFAFHQFSDSILWIPMLAQMKSKATRSLRLQRAIEDNIAHEAGIGGTSHVTLAVALMRSLGIGALEPSLFPTDTFTQSASLWLSDAFERFGEPEIAGFLLTAETLVPRMFAAMVPAFVRLGCDARYFDEHVAIDAEEHSAWMAEAVIDIVGLYGPTCIPHIHAGMTDAWAETVDVPDDLWSRRCASL